MAFNDSYGGNPIDNPNKNFFGGWNSFGNRGSGGGNGGSGQGYPGGGGGGGGMPHLPGPVPNESGNNTTPGAPAGGSDPNNFGQAMHPWDMPYNGQFTAPMSPYENNALQGYNDFVGGGMGLNQSGNYLNDVLGGKYLNLNSNPYLQQIQQGEQGIKDYNDKMALDKIGNSMALGGNAISGARLGATSDYMRNSNNAFESLMGQLMNQNYGMERSAMNQAPGQAANLANTAGGAYSQLFGMGATPRNLQQHDLDSQYNDFLRQTGALNHDSERPDNMLLQFLSNAGYKGQYQPTFGSSQGDILGQLAGQGGWGDILQQLISGVGSGVSGDSSSTGNDGMVIGHDGRPEDQTAGLFDLDYFQGEHPDDQMLNSVGDRLAARRDTSSNVSRAAAGEDPMLAMLMAMISDAAKSSSKKGKHNIGHDAATPSSTGPANYYDRDWYQNALQQAKVKQLASMQNPNPNSNGLAIAALLMSILGGSGGKKKANSVGMGGGPSLANSAGKAAGSGIKSLWDSIFNKPGTPAAGTSPPTDEAPGGGIPDSIWQSMDSGNFNPGSQGFDQTLTNDINQNPWFYQTDNSLPSIPFSGNDVWGGDGGGGGDYTPSDVQF